MPDWTYHPIFKPWCRRRSPPRAGETVRRVLAHLSRVPGGGAAIDFLGHLRADPRLRTRLAGMTLASPVGLAPRFDPAGTAAAAFSRFGVGFVIVGPVGPHSRDWQAEWQDRPEALLLTGEVPAATPDQAVAARRASRSSAALYWLRVDDGAGASATEWLPALSGEFSALIASPRDLAAVRLAAGDRPVFVALSPGEATTWNGADAAAGALIESGGPQWGQPAFPATLAAVRNLRQRHPGLPVIAAGGIHEPADGLALMAAGADAIVIDSGLAFGGPGLPKRLNQELLAARPASALRSEGWIEPRRSWFWLFLLGAALAAGGVMALAIAVTRVLMPYDEALTGLTREKLMAINPRLLAFMTHDRTSLAGTMLAVGLLYMGLAWHAVRRGEHWVQVAVVASALAGFSSFFLFLGFGYFDPFHGFVTLALLQLMLLGWALPLGRRTVPSSAGTRNDADWRRGQTGLLLLVLHATAMLGAGLYMCAVGSTTVFVAEDLDFLGTTCEALANADPRLVPLVAHDRAALGGMLASAGIASLLTALWGVRGRQPWLWKLLFAVGVLGYLPALAVHWAVGYRHPAHLLPALAGYLLLLAGLGWSAPWLLRAPPPHKAADTAG